MVHHALIVSAALCLAGVLPAAAQEGSPQSPPEPETTPREPRPEETNLIESARQTWTIKFEPSMWYMAPSGKFRLPGSAGAGNGDSFIAGELNVDSPRLSPFGELQFKRGDWRIAISGAAFSTDDRGTTVDAPGQIGDAPFDAGDRLRSSLDLVTFSAAGAYAIYGYESERKATGQVRARSTILALAGVRAIDVEIETEVLPMGSTGASAAVGGDSTHAHPYAGLRWELEVLEDFSLDVTAAIGGLTTGDAESWSGDIIVGFQWNPTPHFGAQVGYRQLLLGIEEDESPSEFAWQGGLAGVYAGLTLRF